MEDVRSNMNTAKWEHFQTKNEPPCPNSHLTGFTYTGKLFLFGGSVQEQDDPREEDIFTAFPPQPILREHHGQTQIVQQEPKKPLMFHVLNLQSLTWSDWRKKDFPTYDDFASHFVFKLGILYIFGGFRNGRKSNELLSIDVNIKRDIILS